MSCASRAQADRARLPMAQDSTAAVAASRSSCAGRMLSFAPCKASRRRLCAADGFAERRASGNKSTGYTWQHFSHGKHRTLRIWLAHTRLPQNSVGQTTRTASAFSASSAAPLRAHSAALQACTDFSGKCLWVSVSVIQLECSRQGSHHQVGRQQLIKIDSKRLTPRKGKTKKTKKAGCENARWA